MKRHPPQEEMGRAVAIAFALWTAIVTMAAGEGVLAKLSEATLVALALAALAYATAMYVLDRELRAYVLRASPRVMRTAWLATAAGVVAALATSNGIASLAQWPFAIAAFVLAPLASALSLAEIERRFSAKPRALSSAVAKSPGGHPAAT